MKLMSLKQYMKKSKKALIAKLLKSLKVMTKKELAVMCYQIQKSKLPQLKTTKQKALTKKIKKGKKFTKKQLAAQRLFAKRAKAGTLRKKGR